MNQLRNVLLGLSLSLGALASAGCDKQKATHEASVLVEAGPPKVEDVAVRLSYPVELEADKTVAIKPVAISGFLRRVFVDVGDAVQGGQLIALVDCREYTAQRTQAETVIAKWKAQVDESRSQLDRLTKMGEGLVAPAEIERAQAEARVAEAELADARAKLSEAGQRQGYCSLTAPFSGFVSERLLDTGAMVSPSGLPVVKIVKTRDVRGVAYVTEQDATKVTKGDLVDIEFHSQPGTTFRAQVARLGRALEPSTRTLRVEMDIPNRTEKLLPGMTGRASIVVGKREQARLVPVTAVLRLEDSAHVYVVEQQDGEPRAKRVDVKLGVDLGDWIEILEGISAQDQVIFVGRELVGNGTLLHLAEPTFDSDTPLVQANRVEVLTPPPPDASQLPEREPKAGKRRPRRAKGSDDSRDESSKTQQPPVPAGDAKHSSTSGKRKESHDDSALPPVKAAKRPRPKRKTKPGQRKKNKLPDSAKPAAPPDEAPAQAPSDDAPAQPGQSQPQPDPAAQATKKLPAPTPAADGPPASSVPAG